MAMHNNATNKGGTPNKITKIFSKLVMAAVGVFLIAYPGSMLEIIVRFLGAALLVIALIGVISYIASPAKGLIATVLLVLSIIGILVSIIPLAKPALLIGFFPFVIGIGLAVKGVADVIEAFSLKRTLNFWAVPMILSILTIAAGCVLAFYPFETMDILVRIAGGVCIYNAVVGLFMAFVYKPPVVVNGVIDITDSNS